MRMLCRVLLVIFIGGMMIASTRSFVPSSDPAHGALSIMYHLLAYWLVGMLLRGSFLCGQRASFPVLCSVFFVAACIGGADEFLQSFVPGRTASIEDWSLNCIGAFFGLTGQLRYEPLAFLLEQEKHTFAPYERDV